MSTHAPATETPSHEIPRRRTDDLLAMLADRAGGRYAASSVFGTPVERDGVTVIPVASARFGFGGGSGSDPAKGQDGEGGGAGGMVTPAGYIELKDGRSRFVPAVSPGRMLALMCGTILAALVIARPARSAGRSLRPPWQ
jgi:uncharacterized spore protein YtfJ